MVELPQELIERIIDELNLLQGNRKALFAALSAARSFRIRARLHLFQRIYLANEQHFHKFDELCKASPSILGIVRTIRVVIRPNHSQALLSLQAHPFPHLAVLEVDGWKDGYMCSELPRDDALTLSSKNLSSLTLQYLFFPDSKSFCSCIQSYPFLESLSLRSLDVPASIEDTHSYLGPPIRELSITCPNYGTCALFAGPSPRSSFGLQALSKLRITQSSLCQISIIQHILDAARSTLQELHLCAIDPSTREPQEILEISQIPVIFFEPAGFRRANLKCMSYLVQCLQKSTSSPAELTIRMAFCNRIFEDLDSQGIWAFIDSMPSTCLLLIFRLARDNKHMIVEKAASFLPHLHSTGRVVVQFES
ncbi:hypothetical protein ARMSODRAFT_957085 [Armillaria solidipes]|uniref:F-box domain-containing protein n=1 Tax=Armillaria solidipes TaxID=1076256 RepID=A0A2H3BF25_9AGAR|nr:hypothetical protein ARMSODRAFT_957085 [Armillaria solidipes]